MIHKGTNVAALRFSSVLQCTMLCAVNPTWVLLRLSG